MTRLSRLVLAVALLGAVAACSSPTAPSTTKRLAQDAKPLMECVGGWDVSNGTPCG